MLHGLEASRALALLPPTRSPSGMPVWGDVGGLRARHVREHRAQSVACVRGVYRLHVFAVYIGRNDTAEYKVSRDQHAIYFCDGQTDFRKEPSVHSCNITAVYGIYSRILRRLVYNCKIRYGIRAEYGPNRDAGHACVRGHVESQGVQSSQHASLRYAANLKLYARAARAVNLNGRLAPRGDA